MPLPESSRASKPRVPTRRKGKERAPSSGKSATFSKVFVPSFFRREYMISVNNREVLNALISRLREKNIGISNILEFESWADALKYAMRKGNLKKILLPIYESSENKGVVLELDIEGDIVDLLRNIELSILGLEGASVPTLFSKRISLLVDGELIEFLKKGIDLNSFLFRFIEAPYDIRKKFRISVFRVSKEKVALSVSNIRDGYHHIFVIDDGGKILPSFTEDLLERAGAKVFDPNDDSQMRIALEIWGKVSAILKKKEGGKLSARSLLRIFKSANTHLEPAIVFFADKKDKNIYGFSAHPRLTFYVSPFPPIRVGNKEKTDKLTAYIFQLEVLLSSFPEIRNLKKADVQLKASEDGSTVALQFPDATYISISNRKLEIGNEPMEPKQIMGLAGITKQKTFWLGNIRSGKSNIFLSLIELDIREDSIIANFLFKLKKNKYITLSTELRDGRELEKLFDIKIIERPEKRSTFFLMSGYVGGFENKSIAIAGDKILVYDPKKERLYLEPKGEDKGLYQPSKTQMIEKDIVVEFDPSYIDDIESITLWRRKMTVKLKSGKTYQVGLAKYFSKKKYFELGSLLGELSKRAKIERISISHISIPQKNYDGYGLVLETSGSQRIFIYG